jgi:hypothetical protein
LIKDESAGYLLYGDDTGRADIEALLATN